MLIWKLIPGPGIFADERHTMIHLSLVTLGTGELPNSSHEAIGGLEWVVTLPNM